MKKKANHANNVGKQGEEYTARLLQQKGYTILQQNYHSQYGEIDIIAQNNQTIAFVEVKTRKQNSMVVGEQAVTKTKQKRIITTALLFLQEYPSTKAMRFDVAVVTWGNNRVITECQYYTAAFDGAAYQQ